MLADSLHITDMAKAKAKAWKLTWQVTCQESENSVPLHRSLIMVCPCDFWQVEARNLFHDYCLVFPGRDHVPGIAHCHIHFCMLSHTTVGKPLVAKCRKRWTWGTENTQIGLFHLALPLRMEETRHSSDLIPHGCMHMLRSVVGLKHFPVRRARLRSSTGNKRNPQGLARTSVGGLGLFRVSADG